MDAKILDCGCGDLAVIKSKSVIFGQGAFGEEYWVESFCGLRGKAFDTYDISSADAMESAIEFWNSHFAK
jgi:hypothetical protein